MNAFSQLFKDIQNGDTVCLEQGKTYHVYPEDSFHLKGYFCSNTASREENPDGSRVAAAYLNCKRNITIDGNGAFLVIHGKMTPFLFDACENVTMHNLTVDYACPTMTEFSILENNNGVCVIRMHPDCRFRIDGNHLMLRGENDFSGAPYWEDAADGSHRFIRLYDPETKTDCGMGRDAFRFRKIEQLDAHTLLVTLRNCEEDWIPGRIVQSRNIVRDQSGALFQRCKNLRFENLRVKFMHGLGMVSQFCENVTFFNCDFTPGTGRTIASTADFFQFSGCRGLLRIENCKANGAHDDYINVHGTHLQMVKAEGRSIVVRFMHKETWGFEAFLPGDIIDFICWDTLIPYASAVVVDCQKLSDIDILLDLDRELPAGLILGKDVVENATWTPDLLVRGCSFGQSRGRGVLCTTRGKVCIEHNRFYHLAGGALVVEDDCNFWFESGYTTDIVFRKNEVIGCEYANTCPDSPVIRFSPKVMNTASTAFVHQKLTLTGNVFKESYTGFHTIRLAYLARADISDNTSDAPLRVEESNCGEINAYDNTLMR